MLQPDAEASALPAHSPTALPRLLRLLVAGASLVVLVTGLKLIAPEISSFIVALVLALVLTPLTLWLMRRGVPRTAAITLTLLLVFALGAAVVYLVGNSLTELAGRLPAYGQKLEALRDDAFALAARFGLDTAKLQGAGLFDPTDVVRPAAGIVGRLLAELGHTFFVLLITACFVVEFTLLFPRLEDASAGRTAGHRFADLSRDIQKYLAITTVVNLMSQVVLTIILLSLGVPFVATWIVLAFVLGYVPTVGGVIALVPITLITLLEQGPLRAGLLLLIYVPISFVLGEVVKPRIMQQGFEVSIVTVFFALVLWHFILGPVGVLLAVPLTITIRRLMREFSEDVGILTAA